MRTFLIASLYFQNGLVNVTRVFKGIFTVVVTDRHAFYVVNWRNTP